MSEMGQVIQLDDFLKRRISSGSSATVGQDFAAQSVAYGAAGKGEVARDDWRPIDELYPGLEKSSVLQQAQELLVEAAGVCERALEHSRSGDLLEADLEAMRLTPLMLELFCCRALGEGFGNTVDALMTALRNLAGSPLEMDQLRAIQVCIERLHAAPALSFEDSVQLVEELEEVALNPEPDLGGLAGDV